MTTLSEGNRLGPYRIVRLLGQGGMGAVYEARQEPLDRRVALKTLHAEYAGNKDAVARFFNEAKTLSRLEHPSIVQVSDFGNAADGTAYLVMEYLHGQSLGRRLRDFKASGEQLPVVKTLQFGFQIADVLAVAHEQGIVHRDIKPDNLMLIADAVAPGGERVKLLDFGIAKLTHEGDKGGVKTATQTVMGTPSYMSPEQCAGAGGVDAKTDVYALGCVLYEILAGRPPFVAEGPGQLIGMHLFQSPPSLASLAPKVPEALAELVHRLLTKDKARRPTMSESADALGRLLSRQTGGGTVVRSRPVGSADPNVGFAAIVPTPGTTLGRSVGQQAGGAPRRTLLLGSVAVALLGGGILVASRSHSHHGTGLLPVSTPPITSNRPIIAPAIVAPPVPALPSAPTTQTPTMPVAATQPTVAEKPRATVLHPPGQNTVSRPLNRAISPKPPGASSQLPTKQPPPPKKQIGYVPL